MPTSGPWRRSRAARYAAVVAAALGLHAPARAEEAAGGGGARGDLLVWATARSEDAAHGELRGLQQTLMPIARFLEVPGTAVVPSGRFEGLKPGAFVVAVGLCPAPEAARALRLFRALRADAAARPVTYRPEAGDPDLTCPSAFAATDGGGDAAWHPAAPATTTAPSGRHLTFVALPFSRAAQPVADVPSSQGGLRVLFMLIDARRHAVVDSAEYQPPSDAVAVRALGPSARGLALKVEYADPSCDGHAERFVLWRGEITAATSGDAIRLEEAALTRLREGACGGGDATAEPAAAPPRKAPKAAEPAAHREELVPLPDLP